MIKVTVIALGRLKETYLKEACAEYTKRLSRYCDLDITELSPEQLPDNASRAEVDSALKREAQAITAKIPKGAFTVAMCVEGKKLSSEALAQLIETRSFEGRPLCFIIGSSYGLAHEIKSLADIRLSVSDMTFPHQLFRIMLLEQIYRGFKINEGSAYHK